VGQSFNSATATDGGTADSGFNAGTGFFNNGGIGDSASASGAGSDADAGFGNDDIASALGTDSQALAGGSHVADALPNDNDFAASFGDSLANATGANDLFQIGSPLGDFSPDVAAAVPSDDLGLSGLLADFSALGL
jgi:hypothetical protein